MKLGEKRKSKKGHCEGLQGSSQKEKGDNLTNMVGDQPWDGF